MDLIESLMAGAAERAAALRRPLVTITYAQSLDGALSSRNGGGLAISCAETKLITHRLRAANLGILVGIGTVLADDPSLTARLAGGPHPQPVVLDRLLRIPVEARLVLRQDLSPWVFCGADAPIERQKSLEQRGVRVLRVCTGADGELNLAEVLACLGDLRLTSLMVEGGAKVLTSFLKMRLADQAMLTIAPLWVGGLPSIGAELDRRLAYPALRDPQYAHVGRDMVVWGKIEEEVYAATGPVFHATPAG